MQITEMAGLIRQKKIWAYFYLIKILYALNWFYIWIKKTQYACILWINNYELVLLIFVSFSTCFGCLFFGV